MPLFKLQVVTMLAVTVLFCVLPPAHAEDVQTIIQRSVQVTEADWNASPNYDHYETDKSDQGSKTFSVLMILGSPYNKLVALNGQPLPPEQQAQEQQKLEKTIAQRRAESSQQRAQRIAKYQKERNDDNLLMEQLTKAFNFSLEGKDRLGPYEVYVLNATPRPDYQPPNLRAKALTGMKGKLWIDTKSYQWVRVEAEVINPVSIAGFVARVEPGTRFELEKAPVNDSIWLPKHFAMRAKAKVLFFIQHNDQADETYFDYRKATPLEANAATK